MGYANYPDGLFDIGDMFLVKIRGYDNYADPWTKTFLYPIIFYELFGVFCDNFIFIKSTICFFNSGGSFVTSSNESFAPYNSVTCTLIA